MDGKEPLRVLVIEDYADTAELLAKWVELAGHCARVCPTGFQAMLAAPAFRPHIVLLDIGLPDMYGWELARLLRDDPALSQTRIVAMTAYGTDEDQQHSEDAGIDQYLSKPIHQRTLTTLLEQV
ncbi:MAG TPA: response regulator [Pirellulales bacterium]|nr:response regulator [Pirellulales bacterium]